MNLNENILINFTWINSSKLHCLVANVSIELYKDYYEEVHPLE
jgi:hypothetical protein